MPLDATTPKKPRTEKQREASRANGARSRGASSGQTYNPGAARYARLAQVLLLPGESRKIFMTLADEFVQSLNPQTPIQHLLVGKMLAAHWRQNRLWGAGNSVTPTSLADENRLDRQFYRAWDRYFRLNKNTDPKNNPSDSFPDSYSPSGTPSEPEKAQETQETGPPEPTNDESAAISEHDCAVAKDTTVEPRSECEEAVAVCLACCRPNLPRGEGQPAWCPAVQTALPLHPDHPYVPRPPATLKASPK